MSKFVLTSISNKVLHIELNRGEKKNALIAEMYVGLTEALIEAANNDDIHVIFFKGGKDCFCAGNDISDFLDESVLDADGPISNFLHELARIKKPMVAAVSGPAIGIGTTMLLHCDLVYATNEAVFSLPFVNLGVCAEAGSSHLLARQIGHVRAAELLLLGQPFDATKAKEYGIINDIVAVEAYWDYAQKQAEKLATKPIQALLVTKALMKEDEKILHDVINQEIEHFSKLLKSEDSKNIFKSFLNKS